MVKYKQIEEHIIHSIENGELPAGEKLPGMEALCQKFQVSHITIQKALEDLFSQGYIKRIKGKGSFVSKAISSLEKNCQIVFILSAMEKSDSSLLHIISGAQKVANENHCSLTVELVNGTESEEVAVFERYAHETIDGFLLYVSSHKKLDSLIRNQQSSPPYVIIDHCDKVLPCNYVSPNNIDGGFMATEYLIQKGHQKIAFLTDRRSFTYNTGQDRYIGYKNAMHYYGLMQKQMLFLLDDEQQQQHLMQLIYNKELTALFCVNDRDAMMVESLLFQNGVHVPDDISLVGFDDYEPSKYALVPITTIKQDFYQIGETAMHILLNCFQNREQKHFKKVLLPLELIERSSVIKWSQQ